MATTMTHPVRLVHRPVRLLGIGQLWRSLIASVAVCTAIAVLASGPLAAQGRAAVPVPGPAPAVVPPNDLQALPVERNAPGAVRIEPVEEDYRIGSQDLIEVQVFGLQELKREVRVNGKGSIGLPLIGSVHVGGLTASEAEAMIGGLYRKEMLQNPEVSVFIKEFTRQRFTVEGGIAKPGMYPLKGPTSLMQGLALAGGQGPLGDLKDVVLFRTEDGERRATKLDVEKIRAAEAPDPLLQPDDLIVVNRSSTRVFLRDSVFSDLFGILNPLNYLRP